MAERSVVVIGGGITGLTAAWVLHREHPGLAITVVEGAPVTGGKLRRHEVAGHVVDVGAESVLAVRPEATALMEEVGLSERVCHPSGLGAQIYSRGQLFPMPKGTVMGVPRDPESVRGLLTDEEVERLRAERVEPVEGEDVSVGDFVESRLGPAVVDRLVEPLLAGVYAGHARRLSLRATVPTLWPKATEQVPLVDRDSAAGSAAQPAQPASPGTQAASPRPVFAGLDGGLGQLTEHLTERLMAEGVTIVTGTPARELEVVEVGDRTRWRVTGGPVPEPVTWEADGLVIAAPAHATARMLAGVSPRSAELLAEIDYASMAVITLAFRREDLQATGVEEQLAGGTGFLVPPPEPLTIKASTFSAAKWGWIHDLDPGTVFLRTSIGRAGDVETLQAPDEQLVRVSLADLSTVLGAQLPEPVDAHVQRWGGGLPQYETGHTERIAAAREPLQDKAIPPVVLAGAAYDGVGIPACIASARAQARALGARIAGRDGAPA